jgi:hypothetical protein
MECQSSRDGSTHGMIPALNFPKCSSLKPNEQSHIAPPRYATDVGSGKNHVKTQLNKRVLPRKKTKKIGTNRTRSVNPPFSSTSQTSIIIAPVVAHGNVVSVNPVEVSKDNRLVNLRSIQLL